LEQHVIQDKLDNPVNILIVEDDNDDYVLVCRALDDYGLNFHSSHARNKKELLSIIDDGVWDIVLVDYHNPTLSFVGSIEIIRNHAPLLPVILISDQVGEEIIDDIVDMDIDDFIIKQNLSRLPLSIYRSINNLNKKTSKQKKEHDYLERNKRFELAIKGLYAGIWDWKITNEGTQGGWWSPRFYELIGYKNNEIEANKKTFISLLHPDDVDHVKEHVRAALKNNGYYDIEYRLKLKSGKYNWFQACANVEKDNKGNPIRMTGSLQDINDKKIIEEKLKYSNDELRLIFDNVPMLIFYKDDKNNILHLNKPAADSMGLSVKEAEDSNLYDYFPPAAAKKYRDDDLEVIRSGKPKLGIIQQYLPDQGKQIWVNTDIYPYYDNKSGKQGVLVLSKDITDVKIAGKALANSEKDLLSMTRRLQLATQTARIGVWEWDIKSDKLYWDDLMFELYGIVNKNSPRESYRSWLRCLHPDDRNKTGNIIRHAFADVKEINTEFRIITPSGQVRHIKAHAVVTISNGVPEKLIGINQDITELQNTIDELNLTSDRFMVAAELSSDLIYEWQLESNQVIWHGGIDKELGYKQGEFPQTIGAWADAIHEEDKIDSEKILSTILDSRETIKTQYRIMKKDGTWATWVDHSAAIFDKNNKPTKIIGTCTDITERLKADRKIKESDERNRLLVENSPYCIHQIDLDGNLSSMNPAGLIMMGKADKSEIIGMSYLSLVDDKDKDKISSLLGLAFKGTSSEFVYTTSTGGQHQSSFTSIRDNSGKVIGLMGMIQDITERKKAEEERLQLVQQLNQSQKMEVVGQLTAGISHDFNNILASVLGYTELSLENYVDEKDQKLKEYLLRIKTAGERGRDLISKMLTFSRKSTHDIVAIDPVGLMNDVISLVSPVLSVSINLNFYSQKITTWIKSDATHLQQALANLIINARDAIYEHGEIDLQIEQTRIEEATCNSCHQDFIGEYIVLSVHDNGHGIAESDITRLFEPFFTTKDVDKGTGMGLAMVHGIIHDSNGHILVESTLNEGTTIKLVLPCTEPETQTSIRSDEKHEVNLAGHILLVDDDKLVTELHKEMLTTHGFDVTSFTESKLAFEEIEKNQSAYDLILSDQSMPNMTGAELAEKAYKINPEIPVLIITGYNDISESNINESGNIEQVLHKPISNIELIEVVTKTIRKRKIH